MTINQSILPIIQKWYAEKRKVKRNDKKIKI